MRLLTIILMVVSLLLSAAIFGFFYAWVCSTMWGLDAADPRIAIPAMQAMNASVRNMIFAPAFFGTPVAFAATALLLLLQRQRTSALAFALGFAAYLLLALLVTLAVNVPMNQALATLTPPGDLSQAGSIWRDYSERWQVWNQLRTIASGLAFLLGMAGLWLFAGSRGEAAR